HARDLRASLLGATASGYSATHADIATPASCTTAAVAIDGGEYVSFRALGEPRGGHDRWRAPPRVPPGRRRGDPARQLPQRPGRARRRVPRRPGGLGAPRGPWRSTGLVTRRGPWGWTRQKSAPHDLQGAGVAATPLPRSPGWSGIKRNDTGCNHRIVKASDRQG